MAAQARFDGEHFRGAGDVEYLQLLDSARGMFQPNPRLQNLAMLYMPDWNGLVEGPTWDAWWIQNSYGTTYCALPFLRQPFLTFLQNSQDLWFDQMGDGNRTSFHDWTAPDGCLCDAARPGWIVYRQGDGRVDIHDWALEFTAAGVVMQAELLLITRDKRRIAHYLPLLERCANFIETRRDRRNNLFLAGPAANLLAPSYAGWRRPDGTYGKAYLAGLSITYIAALDRLVELEKLAGRRAQTALYSRRRALARKGLPLLTTRDGYFIKSLDPDGTRHGVYGAPEHGYFETSPNQDAIAFRVVDDAQAQRILKQIKSIPGLRPYDFILPNYPSLDDMYEKPEGLWAFGTWVNGGHWSTCEARMIMAYYRLGDYDEARRSMQRLLTFANRFRMDNPLTKFGSDVYQPNEPINLCYDSFGPAAALVRGLFEYLYRADGLTLVPHIPPGITALEQRDPIRFGTKRVYLAVCGQGRITSVRVNGRGWRRFTASSVFLPYESAPANAQVLIIRGHGRPPGWLFRNGGAAHPNNEPVSAGTKSRHDERLIAFLRLAEAADLGGTYEAAHARLALECGRVARERKELLASGRLAPLPERSEQAADETYAASGARLYAGLDAVMIGYRSSADARKRTLYRLWQAATTKPGPG